MYRYLPLFFLLCLFGSLTTNGQTNSANADIVVALDGSGDFTKIQDAINAVPSNSDRETVIYIKRGTYNTEKLIIPSDKKNVHFIGESRDETVISYHIYDCPDGKCPPEDAALWSGDNIRTSATLTIQGDGFKAENLTIENTAGPVGQAQAITVRSDKVVFINCNLRGYQDTIYFWGSGKRDYFKNCLVIGRTDYIYGDGIAFFDSCEIRSWGGGWITAPSTPKDQAYGFVFSKCAITYAESSPRAGDDGALVRLGRPWHEYPKVAWLYCDMTGKINPEGWGDTWNMNYASTSTDLHLYEYKNTGAGADMSGLADWAGLRAMTDPEALNYTAQKVLAGSDGWNPAAEAPSVQTYEWSGAGTTASWSDTTNWKPNGLPSAGESATVSISDTVEADGGTFAADLNLQGKAKLMVSANSTVNYMAVSGASILCDGDATLSGRISTKDSINFTIAGTLTVDATLSGVHHLSKNGAGNLKLAADNSDFSGDIEVAAGGLEASVAGSLGKGNVTIKNGATLIIDDGQSFFPNARISVETGAMLQLNADLTTSEFYVDGTMLSIGVYTAITNPELISGSGQVVVGRPKEFTFTGATNTNWDVATNFSPALLPEAGEVANCSIEMETTSTVFTADIHLMAPGNIRLRGTHECTGTIFMDEGTNFRYNTGGTGFSLKAPISVEGDVKMIMESGNSDGSSMTLGGPISGDHTVTIINNGKGTVNTGTLVLQGDNSGFAGVWDLTSDSEKYPGGNYISAMDGQSANAFGSAMIAVGLSNKVIFSNAKAAGDNLVMTINDNAKAVLNAEVHVNSLKINDQNFAQGTYSASTNPEYFEGSGSIVVDAPVSSPDINQTDLAELEGTTLLIHGNQSNVVIYSLLGTPVEHYKNVKQIELRNLRAGVYLIAYKVDGTTGTIKFATN